MNIIQTYNGIFLEFNNRFQEINSPNNFSKEEFNEISNNGRGIVFSREVYPSSNDLKEGLQIINKIKEDGDSDFLYNKLNQFYSIVDGDFRSNLYFEEFKMAFLRVVTNQQPFNQEFEKIIEKLIIENKESKNVLANNKNCSPVILFKLFQDDYQSYIKGENKLTFNSLLSFAENPNLPSHCLDQLTFNEKISQEDRKQLDIALVKNHSLSKQNLNIIINRVFNDIPVVQKTMIYNYISELPVFDKDMENKLKNEIFHLNVNNLKENSQEQIYKNKRNL